ncbi:hypothetical protein BACCIP111899_01586 [Bacillus rhizoplanae]|uniref:Uncharacterized protein n=1 Tax=Bacillus rhizoplanae TaxID=2880966 RepID=A0ABM8Y9H6_9BACI|nr:hypothetical protein [Bacillus rhizoplanae]CAG9612410.1 hypothetical protein BACCIP111899_01586 [Bacillus rhizoplanae]
MKKTEGLYEVWEVESFLAGMHRVRELRYCDDGSKVYANTWLDIINVLQTPDVLTPRQIQAIALVYVYELKRAEAAQLLGVSKPAITRVLGSAAQRIVDVLNGEKLARTRTQAAYEMVTDDPALKAWLCEAIDAGIVPLWPVKPFDAPTDKKSYKERQKAEEGEGYEWLNPRRLRRIEEEHEFVKPEIFPIRRQVAQKRVLTESNIDDQDFANMQQGDKLEGKHEPSMKYNLKTQRLEFRKKKLYAN